MIKRPVEIVCKIENAKQLIAEMDSAMEMIKEAMDIIVAVNYDARCVIEEKAPDKTGA